MNIYDDHNNEHNVSPHQGIKVLITITTLVLNILYL